MPAAWPAGVPFKLRRSGAGVTPGETVGRSSTDSGLPRQRAMYTAAIDEYAGTLRMTWAQWVTFDTFRKSVGGGTVTWPGHPGGGSVTVRFVAGKQGTANPDDQAAGKFLVGVVMEVLP